jgi:precorrin-3B synthase
MPTGDGLLARIVTTGATIEFGAWTALCAAARQHGNGIIEVTARGSIQVRGLTPGSAPDFAEAVAALDMAAGGIPIMVDPLAGLDPQSSMDALSLAAQLRSRLSAASFVTSLGPKVSVVIDAGASLHLDAVAADVRLRADPANHCFGVALGGDAASALPLGAVSEDDAVEACALLLQTIAQTGPRARGRDVMQSPGLCAAVAGLLKAAAAPAARSRAEPIGSCTLRDGKGALGIGLPFGHTDADALKALIAVAQDAGSSGMRTAPGRALLIVGLAGDPIGPLAAQAEPLGFVTRANDPRRFVVACAGAPICAAAEIPARLLAPSISRAAEAHLDANSTIHVSGCSKGCAHPLPAALTIVGSSSGCGLVRNGTARDAPFATVPTHTLPQAIAGIAVALEEARRG